MLCGLILCATIPLGIILHSMQLKTNCSGLSHTVKTKALDLYIFAYRNAEAMMPDFKLLVMSNPIQGREEEYNHWYNTRHLQDVVAVPGFRSARRFHLNNPIGYEHQYHYIAIYELDSKTAVESVSELLRRRGTEAMMISDSMDLNGAIAGVFEPCSPIVYSEARTVINSTFPFDRK